MCKEQANQRAKDTLAIMFANGQISFDSFREGIRQLAYDQKYIKLDGREG